MKSDDPRAPHARAIRDYFAGDREACLIIHTSLGEHDELPVSVFFRRPEEFYPFERAALALCRGRVLDVGAGTGVHALYLQNRGHDVCAIDVLPEAIEIMRERGVQDARLAGVGEIDGEKFDTVLMMMNGIGILGTLEGLDRFLADAPGLLGTDGQVLLDSGPGRLVGDATEAAVAITVDPDTYPGEAWIELEYKGERGPPFRELYADSETLCEHARAAGWVCEIVFRDGHGGYVARLTRERGDDDE
jgi:SAM-dependent methyltransferase